MSSANSTITVVMRGVAEALKLDGDNKIQEAYMKYLECVLRICTKLLQDARLGGNLNSFITKDTVKMVRLGQQCMERVSAVVNQIDAQKSCSERLPLQMSNKSSVTKSAPCTPSDQHIKQPAFTHSITIPKEQSPLEQAYKQNQLLMMAYKARLARLDPRRRMATSLTVQRKMAENLAIAKVQEDALKKKMNERQQRLEEQAARRFGTPTGLTDDDKEQRQIYKKVLEFEQESTEFCNLRKELEEKPNDPELINKLIQNIIRTQEHPLTQKMKTQQTKIYVKLEHLVEEKLQIVDQIKVPLSETLYPKHHWEKDTEESTSKNEESESVSGPKFESDSENNMGNECTNKNEETESAIGPKFESDSENNMGELIFERGKECTSENEETESASDPKFESDSYIGKIIYERGKDESEIDSERKDEEEIEEENVDDTNTGDKWEPAFSDEVEDVVETTETVQVEVKDDLETAIDMGDKECRKLKEDLRETTGFLHQISQEYDSYNQDNMDELFDDKENSDDNDEKVFQMGDQINKDESVIKSSASLSDLKSIEMKIKNLKNEAYHRHIKAVSGDIHLYMEKMLVLFTICYEQLDCVVGKDQCYACLEESIFIPIWKYLLTLFRLANEPKELALAYVMTERMTCHPQDCNVKAKLQMTDYAKPYDTVVTHLKTLPQQQTLLSKLECLVKCSRLVCQCIEDYYKNQKIPTIGADDLLPILCYVIVKAGQPQILSECLILEEFIHEGYIMGEEGYCLTSIQTAVGYLISQGMAS